MRYKQFNKYKYYIAMFATKNHAVQVYYVLEKKGFANFQLISTPCRLQPGCGLCIRFNSLEDLKKLRRITNQYNRKIKQVYYIERKNGKKEYKRIKDIT